MVQILALLLAIFIWLIMILWVKAVIEFRYSRIEENDHLEINLSALGGFWKFRITIPTIKLEWEEGPKIAAEQEAQVRTGEKRKAFQELKVRYFKNSFSMSSFPISLPCSWPLIVLKRNSIAESIVLSTTGKSNMVMRILRLQLWSQGSFWAMLGYSLGRMYNQVTMDTQEPQIMVVPQFKKPGFRCDIQSTFNLRIGHIMLIGANLAGLILRRIRK